MRNSVLTYLETLGDRRVIAIARDEDAATEVSLKPLALNLASRLEVALNRLEELEREKAESDAMWDEARANVERAKSLGCPDLSEAPC